MIPHDTLETLCRLFLEDPSLLQNSAQNYFTSACCDEQYELSPELSLCGKFPFAPCTVDKSPWTWQPLLGINIDVVILFIDALIAWGLLILIETGLVKLGWNKLKEKIYGSKIGPVGVVDNDVENEETFVKNNGSDYFMKMINFSKKFNKFEAVKGLTFGVKKSEVFGLLGVNGAGKTTTFRFLFTQK